MRDEEMTDLEGVEKFYKLLTKHEIPEGFYQAFTSIWFLQECLGCLPDTIERCEDCDNLYDTDWERVQYVESKGARLCESCYEAESAYECACCEQHDCHETPGRLLVVKNAYGDLTPGLYRIDRWPFYANGIITGYVFEDALTRVGEVPENAETGGYDMGFLCRDCEAAVGVKTLNSGE